MQGWLGRVEAVILVPKAFFLKAVTPFSLTPVSLIVRGTAATCMYFEEAPPLRTITVCVDGWGPRVSMIR